MRVLEKIRVLDLSPFLPSQYCSFQLAQFGAEVILIERPGLRAMDAFPGLFELISSNKKSLQLDLKSELGKEIFYRLSATSDIVIEGFRPGVADRLKIGYKDIKQIKSDIIYCSISGFGQDGPYRDKPAHDVNYLGLSGYFSIQGQVDSIPSRPGFSLVDLCSAITATMSILASIIAREKTGKGQYIDISMLDAITALTITRAAPYMISKKSITNEHIHAASSVFETKDHQFITLGIINEDHFWQNFCNTVIHITDLSDSRFSNQEGRTRYKKELYQILKNLFLQKSKDEWITLFKNIDVPLSPVSTLEEVIRDPQIKSRDIVKKINDPEYGEFELFGFPAKFSSIRTNTESIAPKVGQNTREIMKELGYSDNVITSIEPKIETRR